MLMWRGNVSMYKTALATSSDVSPVPAAAPSATAAAPVTCQRSFSTTPGATRRADRTPVPISCRRRPWVSALHSVLGRGVHRLPVDGLMSRDGAGVRITSPSAAIMDFNVAWITRMTPPTLVSMSRSNCVTSFCTKSPPA